MLVHLKNGENYVHVAVEYIRSILESFCGTLLSLISVIFTLGRNLLKFLEDSGALWGTTNTLVL